MPPIIHGRARLETAGSPAGRSGAGALRQGVPVREDPPEQAEPRPLAPALRETLALDPAGAFLEVSYQRGTHVDASRHYHQPLHPPASRWAIRRPMIM